jgi:hypothetical protein
MSIHGFLFWEFNLRISTVTRDPYLQHSHLGIRREVPSPPTRLLVNCPEKFGKESTTPVWAIKR